MKDIFHATTKYVDLQEGENLTIRLNEEQARAYGINALDKVALLYKGQEYVLDVNLTHRYVSHHEVGIPKDVREKYEIPAGTSVHVKFTQTSSVALDALKKGLK